MFDNKIKTLKAKQDELDSRRKKLLGKFVPFREELLNGLERFIESALDGGLRNVTKPKRAEDKRELIKITFTLNSMELVLIAINDAHKLDPDSDELASKIFVYNSGDENNTPLIEVAFIESANETYHIRIRWFSQNGVIPLSGDIPLSDGVGSKAALILVKRFYKVEFAWQDQPTMKAALVLAGKRSLGFVKE